MIALPKELQQTVRASRGQPVRLTDPKTNIEYVVLPAEIFDQMQIFFCDVAPLTDAEKQNLLVSAGLRAGWDDAEMAIYDELDPRRDHENPTR